MKRMTLCVVHDARRVLLGMKKRGFGEGRWNGFGGKLHEGETPLQAAARELHEEVGITAAPRPIGVLRFHLPGMELEVHLFRVTSFTGEPVESEEMRPAWFAFRDVPYETMWPDDRHWLPRVLAGESLDGEFWFSDEDTIERFTLTKRS